MQLPPGSGFRQAAGPKKSSDFNDFDRFSRIVGNLMRPLKRLLRTVRP
jgi:hypothetical protein